MQSISPEHNFLIEDFQVYVNDDGRVLNVPAPGYVEKTLPTINTYAGPDGGYIACYSKDKNTGVYCVGGGIYVVGQIRLQGKYIARAFHPKGYEDVDISAEQKFKDLCDEYFPDSAPCWAVGDTGSWFGFRVDTHDERDKIAEVKIPKTLPKKVDLSEWCSPVVNQGKINSCTAHAAVALVEYFEKRASGNAIAASRLFLYKVTRNFMHQTGDTGANTRTTMKALASIGVTPEEYWPYDETKIDDEPTAFCYALANRYRSIDYKRIDPKDRPKDIVLKNVKAILAQNRPVMFGVMAYFRSWQQFAVSDRLPMPTERETLFGAHNMAVMGYDDTIETVNKDDTSIKTVGAFLVKNSYGEEWGNAGYGWVPYDYLLDHKSIDWWTISKQNWLDTSEFG